MISTPKKAAARQLVELFKASLAQPQSGVLRLLLVAVRILARLLLGQECGDRLIMSLVPDLYRLTFRLRKILPVPRIVEAPWLGMSVYLRDLEDAEMLSPEYEPEITDLFKPSDGEVVVDVGAHIGRYTLLASRLLGKAGLVIALEPEPHNFCILVGNVRRNALRNVWTLEAAASDYDGEGELCLSRRSGGHSLVYTRNRHGRRMKVLVRRLDAICSHTRVDWIKIDTEGSEASVLKGAMGILRRHHPKLIVECFKDRTTKEICSLIHPLGYTVRQIMQDPPYVFAASPKA